MNDIKIFSNPQFGDIRTTGTADEPLFCAADVTRALGYSNGRDAVAKHCDEGDVAKCDTPTKSGIQIMTFVTESGLYALIFGSKLDSAKQFKKWVTGIILPSIRKHGAYMTDKVIERTLTDPDYLIEIATKLKDERRARMEAEERAAYLRTVNETQAKQIEDSKPKVVFADSIVGSKSSILIGQLAKMLTQNGYKIGQNRLFKWMRDNHYLGSFGSYYNIPYQAYVEQGLFEVKVTCHTENERMVTSSTTKVTGKGQQYFINLFLNGNGATIAQ